LNGADIAGAARSSAPRYASVDALRGLTVAAMLLVNNPGDWGHVYAPLEHATWNGFTPTDLIFPMFLFIVGVSIALALMPRVERGDDTRVLTKTVLVRGARILGLGLLLHLIALFAFDVPHYRVPGVLQRIGLCFAMAGVLALHTKPRTQWLMSGALLAGYGALLAAGGTMEPFVNIASRIDTRCLACTCTSSIRRRAAGTIRKAWSARSARWRRRCWACARATGCVAVICVRC